VFNPDYLIVSFDDDGPSHYAGDPTYGICEVPVTSSSSGRTYGSAQRRDEVMGLHLLRGDPYGLGPLYPVASESSLHVDLGPDPLAGAHAHDDDVDALDVLFSQDLCGYWLFSPDHEATGLDPAALNSPLDPGAIYQVAGSSAPSMTKVVDPQVHLGLAAGVDIDAFEFAWVCLPSSGDEVLALLFSVAEDDYLTPAYESGGLDPRVIYASHLTGSSFEFVASPLPADLDAIAIWCQPMAEETPLPCPADVSGDGQVDVQDLVAVLLAWGSAGGAADVNADGVVDVQDLVAVLLVWGPCP
jgi:hypothetical protein